MAPITVEQVNLLQVLHDALDAGDHARVRSLLGAAYAGHPLVPDLDSLLPLTSAGREIIAGYLRRLPEPRLGTSLFLDGLIEDNTACGVEYGLMAVWPRTMSFELVLNWLIRRMAVPSKRLAVLMSASNEGPKMLEWIAHYKAIGADSILIYTNDNDDGSHELFAALNGHHGITIVQNPRPLEGTPGADAGVQYKAYGHALYALPVLYDHEWVAVVDADEIWIPSQGDAGQTVTAPDLLHNVKADQVILPMKFVASHLLARAPGSCLVDSFRYGQVTTEPAEKAWYKGVVRPRTAVRLRLNSALTVPEAVTIDDRDTVIPWTEMMDSPPSFKVDAATSGHFGEILHFFAPSWAEFTEKVRRGRPRAGHAPRGKAYFFLDQGETEAFTYPADLRERLQASIEVLLQVPGVPEAVDLIETRAEAVRAHLRRRLDERGLPWLEPLAGDYSIAEFEQARVRLREVVETLDGNAPAEADQRDETPPVATTVLTTVEFDAAEPPMLAEDSATLTLVPEMDAETYAWFATTVGAEPGLLEFGCGGSTYVASTRCPLIVSVESDRLWIDKVEAAIRDLQNRPLDSRIRIIHGDIGPTKAWGRPVNAATTTMGLTYALNPLLTLSDDERNAITLCLVDGRFRVASAMAARLSIPGLRRILFDDYVPRPHYAPVEELFGKPEIVGRSAVFTFSGPLDEAQRQVAWRVFAKFQGDSK
ncbi:MAG: glycosyltransferase family 2 protein [Candidatus Nanopelagicales bacterium]|nr:glycosyltransferase family 2 protein [Candidatus Nanopelagicales bacterium]